MSVSRPTAERAVELREAYDEIAAEVAEAGAARPAGAKPRLVAVSKLKPSSDILALYEHGVRHFGENYPQELEAKAKELPTDIEWHFIGALQSNKCKLLAAIPNLYAVETLSTTKAATLLHKALAASTPPRTRRLNVSLQVNTSGEDAKAGVPSLSSSSASSDLAASELALLALHILSECPTLRLKGLMTIGSFSSSTALAPNPDFTALGESRDALLAVLQGFKAEGKGGDKVREGVEEIERDGLEMSCGMSEDFVQAIRQGSTSVRVGFRIFGARPKKAGA